MNAFINGIENINLEASCMSQQGFSESSCDKDEMVKIEICSSGIVTYEDIKRGEFAIEYVGEVNRDTMLYKTYKGNKSRYINHSLCSNIEMWKWIIDS